MDTAQVITIVVQIAGTAIIVLGGVWALSGRLTRIEGKQDAFASNCLLKHIRVDEKLLEGKADINRLGKKIDVEVAHLSARIDII